MADDAEPSACFFAKRFVKTNGIQRSSADPDRERMAHEAPGAK
jgi:hypothetical protein